MANNTPSKRGSLDDIFPVDDLEEVTLGYEDFSDGIITAELNS